MEKDLTELLFNKSEQTKQLRDYRGRGVLFYKFEHFIRIIFTVVLAPKFKKEQTK